MKTIKIDVRGKTEKTDFSWQQGIGADHARQFQRADMISHLKYAHDELGFRSVRFHGIFDDDMWTVSDLNSFSPMPSGDKVREINFRQCADVYDNVLSAGVKPYVELSFMPTPLAAKKKYGLKYKNNTAIPKSWKDWEDYIRSFISFLIERYGREEVESWYFEVWNEPDLKGFFAGSKADYFKLYEVTARAVKSIDERLQVGGPSTSACKWIDEFIAHCEKNQIPLDFISTHHYPGDAFGNLIGASNYPAIFKTMVKAVRERRGLTETMMEMFFDPHKAAAVIKGAISVMDKELLGKTGSYPVFISEWNSMAIYGAPVHDEKYAAAFIVKSVLDLNNRFKGYFFWCLSDIFEELLQLNRPFFGGYGIISNDEIAKPSFWAFKFLSQLYEDRIIMDQSADKDIDYAAFRSKDSLQILVTAQSNDPLKDDIHEIDIELNSEVLNVRESRIDNDHCNPKRLWLEMGKPDNLSKEQVAFIKEKSKLTCEDCRFDKQETGTSIRCRLHTNDVVLYTVTLGG